LKNEKGFAKLMYGQSYFTFIANAKVAISWTISNTKKISDNV